MSDGLALIIANSEFDDPKLRRLVKPSLDAEALSEVLSDPEIGDFKVTTLINKTMDTVRREIASLYVRKKKSDRLLLYYSGHGIRDEKSGELYLAVKDTEFELPSAAAIEAAYVERHLDKSNSQRKVVILDCCHSGAFMSGGKGVLGSSAGAEEAFLGDGFGRVILTASNAIEQAWEGDELLGEAAPSVFTHFLVQGLRTGAADADKNGKVSIDELYEYVHDQVLTSGHSAQTPQKFSHKVEGPIIIAKNPHPEVKPAELPVELQKALDASKVWMRVGAVSELQGMLHRRGKDLAVAAHQALVRLAEDDSRRVSAAASEALAAYSEQKRAAKEPLPSPEQRERPAPVVEPAPPGAVPGQQETLKQLRNWLLKEGVPGPGLAILSLVLTFFLPILAGALALFVAIKTDQKLAKTVAVIAVALNALLLLYFLLIVFSY